MSDQGKVGQVLIIAGLPASGKGTHAKRIIELGTHKKMLTYCTRPMRPGEVHGVDYMFTNEITFKSLEKSGEIIESDMSGSTYKGTSRSQLERLFNGEDLIWEITAKRAAFAEEFFIETFGSTSAQKVIEKMFRVFVTVHDPSILLSRYITREENPNINEFKKRLKHEMKILKENKDRFTNIVYNDGPAEPTTRLILELAREKLNTNSRKKVI